jgi:hypothetical protein
MGYVAFVVSATGKTVFGADFSVWFSRVDVRFIYLGQQTRHEQADAGTIREVTTHVRESLVNTIIGYVPADQISLGIGKRLL